MNKVAICFAFALLLLLSCDNKELCPTCQEPEDLLINLVINWEPNQVKPVQGMRANLFSLNDLSHYGIDDIESEGTRLYLPPRSVVKTFCYLYQGNNIYFRNESDMELIEAYTAPTTRATYTRAFPDENTYAQPQGPFYVGINERFEVVPDSTPQVLNVWVEDYVKTYTFEVRKVKGTAFITSTRGGIAGMSNSVLLATKALSPVPATLLFQAKANKAENKIEGSFQTFGHQPLVANIFTIEILYPLTATTSAVLQKSWDVSDQVNTPGNYHIIIDISDLEVPDNGGGGGGGGDGGDGGGGGGGDGGGDGSGGGFGVTVEEWENETILLN